MVLLVAQHIGGINIYYKGVVYSLNHRKMAVVVSNLGRLLAVLGMVYADWSIWLIYSASLLGLLMLVGSVYKVFVEQKVDDVKIEQKSEKRGKSPIREAKKD